MSPATFIRRRRIVAAVVALWAAVAVWGWYSLAAHSLKTDDTATQLTTDWPAASQLPRRAGLPALVVFLHPKCPCTRAAVAEIERILGRPADADVPECQVLVVAVTPAAADDAWIQTPLLEQCRRLPGADVFEDRGGVEAARFGAVTSGTVVWFDAAGRRQYGGGITIARGHEGRSEGGLALKRLLHGQAPHVAALPVFGCRLPGPPASQTTLDAADRVTPTSMISP